MTVDHSLSGPSPFAPPMCGLARANALRLRLLAREPVRALVIGAGASGLGAIRLLQDRGAIVEVADDRPREALAPAVRAALGTTPLAPLSEERVEAAELVVLSPGVPRVRPELAGAREDGRLFGEIELASWFVKVPLIGITGTNGKSTTTALTAKLLNEAGIKAFAGGNLGTPLSDLARDPEDYEVAVVELSSYQLESVVEVSFRVACWLNLSPDHLDRYESVEAYTYAKRRLIERRSVHGLGVLNADDPWCAGVGIRRARAMRWFSTRGGRLSRAGGSYLLEDRVTIRRTEEGKVEEYRVENPALIGDHNKANAAAAIECARALGASPEGIQRGLERFEGLAHRIQHIAQVGGVDYYNDSKATNVDSAVTAVNSFSRPTYLIVGGTDKGAPWGPLVEAARGRVKAVLTIGDAAPIAQAAFAPAGFRIIEAGTLDAAVSLAAEEAAPGDVVLLSPACASFDQFKSFVARGEAFRAAVQREGGLS